MTTYNTGNPVGSTDVRDLYDNAQNLDSMVNGPLASYADRLGAPRKSWRGIEQDFSAFLAASGFELPALEYVDGTPLVVDRPTQLIFRTGFTDTLYGVKSTEPFPATLSGTWSTDEGRLVVRSDGDLRQDLANSTDPAKGAGLVGYAGVTVGEELDGINFRIGGVQSDLGSVAGAITSNSVALTDPAQIVALPITTNKANPEVADASLPTFASQLHRVYNPGGALSPQSPSTLGTFAVTRKYFVDAGKTYAISLDNAELGWYFYFVGTPVIRYFDAAGAWLSDTTTGFTRGAGDRSVVFTVPAGAARVSFIVRNVLSFSNTNPITESEFVAAVSNIMLAEGSAVVPFVPFSDGTFTPTTALFESPQPGAITVVRQGVFFYIRTKAQMSPDKDIVWRVLAGHGVNYNRVDSRSGVVDFYGIRFIDRDRPDTVAAFNTSALVHNNGMDESCPIKLNSMFLAGGHGVIGYRATSAGHGKADVDIGSIWSDGVSQWVLYRVGSADTVMLVRRWTGTVDKWRISSETFASATLTHVSGATNTADISITASAQEQFVPIVRDYLYEMRVDDVPITGDGTYRGQRVALSEIYTLMNMARQQDYLIANVGSPTPSYINSAIGDQVRFYYEYQWSTYGAMSVRAAIGAKEAYSRTLGADYWGGIQMQRLSLPGDSTPGMQTRVALYIPETAPVSGFDFEAVADITDNAALVRVPATACDDPANPASHFALIGRNGSGNPVAGHLYGYSRDTGLGVPAVRANAATDVMYFSSAEKQYPIAVDSKAGDAAIGDIRAITAFRAPFLPTDPDLTIPGVVVNMDGINYVYITTHQALSGKPVLLPGELSGQKITVIKPSSTLFVLSQFVTGGAILVESSGYGDVVIRLG